MEICDNCNSKARQIYKSVGGLKFCHECAHTFGLTHKHPGIEDERHLNGCTKKQLKGHLKKYETEWTEDQVNKIIDLTNSRGEPIDVFQLFGILFVGNTEKGEWDLSKKFVRYNSHSLGISIEDFQDCVSEDDVKEEYYELFMQAVISQLL